MNIDYSKMDFSTLSQKLSDEINSEVIRKLVERRGYPVFHGEFRQITEYPDFPSGNGWNSPSTRKNSR